MSPFWERRLEAVGDGPFKLRLLNGMLPPVPEALIMVDHLERDEAIGEFRTCTAISWLRGELTDLHSNLQSAGCARNPISAA